MKINKWLIILLISFINGSCDCGNEPLEEVLGQPCMISSDKSDGYILLTKEEADYINKGICKHGNLDRNEEGQKVCLGEVTPVYETCNGLDDDCDNIVDNPFAVDRGHWELENECVGVGVCRYTEQVCVNGQYICDYPDSYGNEICDGRDNDCDGDVDEDTDEDPIFDAGERYIYYGDPETINVGECRAGYKECVDGRVSIRNMRTPVTEICGNDDDDDCDGFIDERENDNVTNDIVFIIDYSGSMSGVIQSVSDALCEWSSQGVLVNSRFAVVAIGYVDSTTTWKETKVLTDFTDSGTACSIIRQNNRPVHQGGLEYQLDAIYDSGDPNTAQQRLTWLSEQKKVFVFTDERMQYSFAPILQDALDMIMQQCMEQSYIIGAFISYDDINQSEWVDLTQQCGGFLDYLSNDPRRMIDAMNYWIGTDC
jgi:hypothetical protein